MNKEEEGRAFSSPLPLTRECNHETPWCLPGPVSSRIDGGTGPCTVTNNEVTGVDWRRNALYIFLRNLYLILSVMRASETF